MSVSNGDVSHSASPLWSNIHITPSPSLDKLEVYLTQSQPHLLDIELVLNLLWLPPNTNHKNVACCLMALMPHTEHPISLSFYFPLLFCLIATTLHNLSVPNLMHFAAYGPWFGDNFHVFEAPIFTASTPHLSHLECLDVSIQNIQPPLGAITHLCLQINMPAMTGKPLSSHCFIKLLGSVPALTNLALEGIIVTKENMDNFLPIILAHLESPSITEYDVSYLLGDVMFSSHLP